MSKKVKSLVEICQDLIGRHIDGVTSVGDLPFWLLERPLKKATGDQLVRIEAYNPHLMSDIEPALWLNACRAEFKEIRDTFKDGDAPKEAPTWRAVYMKRKKELDRKLAETQKKVRNSYLTHSREKQARSVVVIDNLPRARNSNGGGAKKRSNNSIFQKSLLQTKRHSLIYNNEHSSSGPSVPWRFTKDNFQNFIPTTVTIGPRVSPPSRTHSSESIAKCKSLTASSSKSLKRPRTSSLSSTRVSSDVDGVTQFFAQLSSGMVSTTKRVRTGGTPINQSSSRTPTDEALPGPSSRRPGVIVRHVTLPAEMNFFKEILNNDRGGRD